jgi:hypothetical protein
MESSVGLVGGRLKALILRLRHIKFVLHGRKKDEGFLSGDDIFSIHYSLGEKEILENQNSY